MAGLSMRLNGMTPSKKNLNKETVYNASTLAQALEKLYFLCNRQNVWCFLNSIFSIGALVRFCVQSPTFLQQISLKRCFLYSTTISKESNNPNIPFVENFVFFKRLLFGSIV